MRFPHRQLHFIFCCFPDGLWLGVVLWVSLCFAQRSFRSGETAIVPSEYVALNGGLYACVHCLLLWDLWWQQVSECLAEDYFMTTVVTRVMSSNNSRISQQEQHIFSYSLIQMTSNVATEQHRQLWSQDTMTLVLWGYYCSRIICQCVLRFV